MRKFTFIWVLTVLILVVATLFASDKLQPVKASENTVQYTFEGSIELPDAFTTLSGDASIQTINQNNVLRISDNSPASITKVELDGAEKAAQVFEMKVYPKVLDKAFGLYLSSKEKVAYQLTIYADGSISYFTDTSHSLAPAGTIEANNWYDFRIEADLSGVTKLYIDDQYIGDIPKRNHDLSVVDRATFFVGSTYGIKDVIYIDDVSFSKPEQEQTKDTVQVSMEPIFTIQPDDGGINQFPDAFKFGDDIFVPFQKHLDAAIPDGSKGMRISRDNGATFTEYYESTDFPRNGNMAQLTDGRLYYVKTGTRIDKDSVEVFSYVSSDSGVTWTKRTGTLETPKDTYTRGGAGMSTLVFSGDPIVEADGTMYNSLYARYLGDSKWRVLWAKSTDNGLNWAIVSTIASASDLPDDLENADGFAEPAVARVADGSLLAVMRTKTMSPMLQSRSYDNGLTWTKPKRLPDANGGYISDADASSVYPDLEMLSNGLLALSYGRPDNKLLISADGSGYQWDYLTVTYDDPTNLINTSGMTGMVETSPNRLLIVGDTGAVAFNPSVQSIWGRFVDVSMKTSNTRNFSKAIIGDNIDKIALSDTTESVHVIVLDQDGRMIPEEDFTVTYSSNNASVVTVDADGLLTPVGVGNATISATITYQGVAHFISRQVTVINDDVINGLEYRLVKPNLVPNEQTRFIAWAINELGEEVTKGVQFTYESSEPSIATVSADGTITSGETIGKATIGVTASKNGITFNAQEDVTVVEDVIDPITFEGDMDIPVGFTTLSGDASIATIDQNNVLRISDHSPTDAAEVELVGTQTATKVLETKVYPQVLDKSFGILLWSLNGMKEVAYQITILADGSINYFTDKSYPLAPAGTIAANNWYEFRLEVNSLGVTKLFIDDQYIGDIPQRSYWLNTVDRVSFIAGSSSGTKDVIYIDDVSFFDAISIPTLQQFINTYEENNQLKGPIIHQLENRLAQAKHHYEKDSITQAAKHMRDFVKHLNNKGMQKFIDQEAKTVLETEANNLIKHRSE